MTPARPAINIFRSKLIWLMPIILSASLLTGCNQEQTKTQSPYPVIDSGVWSRSMQFGNNYWLDNNRVIFLTVRGQIDGDMKRHHGSDYVMKIWTINNGVTRYGDASGFCYHDGVISYMRYDRAGKFAGSFHGEFGKEQPFIQDPNKKLRVNDIDCRLQDQDSIRYRDAEHYKDRYGKSRLRPKRSIRFLKSNHGYVDKGPLSTAMNGRYPVVLHKPDGTTVTVSITAHDFFIRHYYIFKDAYFIQKLQTNWRPKKKNLPETAWWLYPDGRVEDVKIPYGPWKRYSRFYPTKKGVVIVAGGHKSRTDSGAAGAYLLQADGSHIKLLAGTLDSPRVSPDGCKLAASHNYTLFGPGGEGPPRVTLKVIDLCPEVSANGQ